MQDEQTKLSVKRSIQILVGCIAVATGFSAAVSQDHNAGMYSLVPVDALLKAWTATDTARIFAGDDLFSFIDGGAVLFFEYGFDRVISAEYNNTPGNSINLEIYRMKEAGAAYGIYSIRTSERGLPTKIGQEGTQHSNYIMFWKGEYYVSVAGSDSVAATRQGVEAIARTVEQKLEKTGPRPEIIESLPRDGLLKTRYFRGSLGLSTVDPRVGDLISGLSEGGSGKYSNHTLFLLRYGSEQEAGRGISDVAVKLRTGRRFRNVCINGGVTTTESNDGTFFCFAQSGNSIVAAVSADELIATGSCYRGLETVKSR